MFLKLVMSLSGPPSRYLRCLQPQQFLFPPPRSRADHQSLSMTVHLSHLQLWLLWLLHCLQANLCPHPHGSGLKSKCLMIFSLNVVPHKLQPYIYFVFKQTACTITPHPHTKDRMRYATRQWQLHSYQPSNHFY